jgi:hypothetical protein
VLSILSVVSVIEAREREERSMATAAAAIRDRDESSAAVRNDAAATIDDCRRRCQQRVLNAQVSTVLFCF